ncbi:MAG: hypothetical protein Q8P22_10770 [Chloroflexota bacterium]|nr:hypothetical protein [Chloroflexota bacterium]
MNDMEILTRAYGRERDPRNGDLARRLGWEHFRVGATKRDIQRLQDEGLVELVTHSRGFTTYHLTERGRGLVAAMAMEHERERIPAASILEALDLVVGFDDLKQAIALAIESRRRTNILLEGPPACAKSVLLEGVRSAVPTAYIAFGSRTSGAGLSEALFERQPTVLLLDEADKMPNEVYAVLLGLMEQGEVLETKSRKSRGIKLNTTVLAACNSSARMPVEFLSRFALHAHFSPYTRQEFLDVCREWLGRAEQCPPDLAELIGQSIYDLGLGGCAEGKGGLAADGEGRAGGGAARGEPHVEVQRRWTAPLAQVRACRQVPRHVAMKCEKLKHGERARSSEEPTRQERATKSEEPMIHERARYYEKPIVEERAGSGEDPKGLERARSDEERAAGRGPRGRA